MFISRVFRVFTYCVFAVMLSLRMFGDSSVIRLLRIMKKGEFRAGLYPPGIESRNTTPHAINGLVEVKKASSPPSSTTPCVLAHTESRARDNGCARVACVQGVVRVAG